MDKKKILFIMICTLVLILLIFNVMIINKGYELQPLCKKQWNITDSCPCSNTRENKTIDWDKINNMPLGIPNLSNLTLTSQNTG